MLFIRCMAVASNILILATALAIRAVADGPIEQISGTALYTSMVYCTIVFIRPGIRPVAAAGMATAFSWAVELVQLTGIPAALSAHSLAARLMLGVRFDPADLAWYPIGALLMLCLHWMFVRVRQRS